MEKALSKSLAILLPLAFFLASLPAFDAVAQLASIKIEKATNGEDADTGTGPYITAGDPVTWTYEITNTGNVDLTSVAVSDDQAGVVISCPGGNPIPSLTAGSSVTCTATGTAVAGQYANLGTATGTPELGDPVSADDPSHYFGFAPGILIVKKTNGESADTGPGPTIPVGDTVSWTYEITNTGNVEFTGVTVTDDQLENDATQINCGAGTNVISSLSASGEAGDSVICTATGTAEAGPYANMGYVTGTPEVGDPVSADNPSHYFGSAPGIDIEKATNGEDADTGTGPYITAGDPVTWTYVVRNTGNVDLTSVAVSDDQAGVVISCPGGNPFPSLTVGSSVTCTAIGAAVAGQYANLGTATGTPELGGPVSADDPSHYFGSAPGIDILKLTNGADAKTGPGPSIPVGDTVTWTYRITNTGNVELTDLTVTDDQLENDETQIDCGAGTNVISSLSPAGQPGDSADCTATGIAEAGPYANQGYVTGTAEVGDPVSADDTSHYFGFAPGIAIVKRTNGESADTGPGPSIPVGDTVTWTYEITNTGNVELTDVTVTDDRLKNDATQINCGAGTNVISSLSASGEDGDTVTCTATGIAEAGPYANMGYVTGTPEVGAPVSADNTSHYFGFSRIIVDTNADTIDANGGNCTSMAISDLPGADGVTSLREAICAANGTAGADTITFAGDYTITLGSALPDITTEISIDGTGQSVTVSGNNAHRVFYVDTGSNLTVDTLTIANGYADNGGGGIFNAGTVTVTNSTLSSNDATNIGGGISNTGTMIVTNSTFSNNSSASGGDIYNSSTGTLTLTSNTFSNNSSSIGVNIFNESAMVYLSGNIFKATSGSNCENIGTLNDNGYNLSDDASCGFTGTGSANNATLNLGALSGGVHTPQAGSDAIGAIPYGTSIDNNGVTLACNGATTDQLGADRPINIGTACTAGAVEVEMPPICTSWTVTSADELYECITLANANESPDLTADTITLGADINLSAALPQITSEITLEGANHFIDGGNSVQLFYVDGGGDFTVNQATLQNGSASNGGGIDNRGTLTVTDSTVSGNSATNGGGGIFNVSTLTVTSSTFSGNSATNGGGILELTGTLTVSNSTFSGNSASDYGGGIRNNGALTVTNSTFSGNNALNEGGISTLTTAYLSGVILDTGSSGANCSSNIIDNGYNLSDDASCGFSGTSADNATLNLDALSGGVHTPQTGSDAIGAIPHGTSIDNNGATLACNSTTTDQIGADRPINVATACTSGAVEVAMPSLCPAPLAISDTAELENCITWANANPGADTLGLDADITLSAALTQITTEITLEGGGFYVDGADTYRVFYVTGTGNLTINRITVQNGSASNGGGIDNRGTLTVTNSTISGNSAASNGGGIYNTGSLTVTSSTFSGNSADNFGGGIYNTGTLTVTTSTISGNNAFGGGGIDNDGILTVNDSTFSGNSAINGGGINNYGTVHLAGNVFDSGATGDNCINYDTLNDNGYNLSDDASCGFSGTSADNATLNLSALSVTTTPGQQVHVPQTGSAAIGAIPYNITITNNTLSWTCNQTFTDQLGDERPINSGDDCTSGAVEVTPICTSWTVTTADELSGCITLANGNESPSPTADTITLGADIDLTTLTASPLPPITSAITLEGANHVIDGGWDGVPGSGNGTRIFYVASTGDFTVNQATLQNGEATEGGAIYNFTDGVVTANNSTFDNNSATDGGAIYNSVYRTTLTVTNSTFTNNSATDDGGAIYNSAYDTTLTVSNSTFTNNSATDGGAISHKGDDNTHVTTIINSTFSGNSATYGGAIYKYFGMLTVSISTFSGNSAPNTGGIYSGNYRGALTVSNSTFSGNLDGGIRDWTPYLAGNIFVAGTTGNNCTIIDAINDNGYNLSDDASCGFTGTGSINNATLNLGALTGSGPGKQVHLPQTGSAAIGAIPYDITITNNSVSWTCNQTFTDQLGNTRPISDGEDCTGGAVEYIDLCSAIASGDWTDSEIWSCRLVPTDTIVAVVADGYEVAIDSSSTDNRAGTLMIVSGGVLQIQGGLTVGQGM